ncbi:MAG: ATP phosphoribosyltransferase [Flavobacteriaceae bacterium]|nr:ATP phosphoribosyltransferase [Flavobacteriaceae bacterium]
MINIAIQKSGRLHEGSLNLLKKCGINLISGKNQLKVKSQDFPLYAYYLRSNDIPKYVEDGVVDLGIIGSNLIEEKAFNVEIVNHLGFAKCRVSLAIPKSKKFNSIQDLQGTRIATSYPNTLKKFLKKNGISAQLHKINGSVEISPNIGLSDAIFDIVSSGNTLYMNNLKEVVTILKSEAVLIKSPELPDEKKQLVEKLNFRIQTVLLANRYRYILFNVPNEKIEQVSSLLPVLKSPTVLPLLKKGWSSLHSVIDEVDFWDVIYKLKEAGAEDILISPIEKMVR